MTMPNEQNRQSGFLESAAGQVTLLAIAIFVVLILAWRYVF
jgi:hypothetical protein